MNDMGLFTFTRFGAIAVCIQLAFGAPTPEAITAIQRRHVLPPNSAIKAPLLPRANASCTNSATSRHCWSGGFDITTDSETSHPVTGKTVSYTLDVVNTTLAPDGTERMVFAVNGQFPGPTIEADWGDTLSITVKNSLQNNGTSIHWHGIQQQNTNDQDGVNGVTECPLAPGDSKTYSWLATQYGTSWYHSHHSTQYGDGVQGPIVINGPASANYETDLGAYPITDWYYTPSCQLDEHMAYPIDGLPPPPPQANNGLINGTMVSSNGGSYAKTTLQPGKTHRLRLINTSVDNHFKVHLDGHTMSVIQADFVAVEPQPVDWLFIGIGQRYDVLITANATVDTYWFRAEVQAGCGNNSMNGNILSIFSYDGAEDSNPTSTATTYTQSCTDQTGLVPYVSKNVPSDQFASANQELDVLLSTGTNASWSNGTTVVQWSLDGKPFSLDWEKPTLSYVFDGQTSDFTANQNVIQLPTADTWTFWIIQSIPGNLTDNVPHPIHLHGHDFYVLGSDSGTFSDVGALNFENPTRRDVAMLPAAGWLVLAFQTDNPGAWLMHCHIAWHVSEGLAVQFLERASEIPKTFSLPSDYDTTCSNWDAYSKSALFSQFESGV